MKNISFRSPLIPMKYSQGLSTQVTFIPVGDVVRTTNRQVCDRARNGHHRVLLIYAAVHLVRHKRMCCFAHRPQMSLFWLQELKAPA